MMVTSAARLSYWQIGPQTIAKSPVVTLTRYTNHLSCPPIDARFPKCVHFSRAVRHQLNFLVARAAVAEAPSVEEEVEEEEELEARAILRYCRGSPFKMRRVIDTIRGRSYEDALIILEHLPYRATEPILKTLLSAAANAKHNLGMKKTQLYVSECFVDEAPTFKRFRCAARGRQAKILKRNSHITIKVKARQEKDASS